MSPKIVVIDEDTETIAKTCQVIRLHLEAECIEAYTNQLNALRALRNGSAPTVIVLDASMPVIDGSIAAAWLRYYFPQTQILIWVDNDSDSVFPTQLGCAVVRKRALVREFLPTLRRAIAHQEAAPTLMPAIVLRTMAEHVDRLLDPSRVIVERALLDNAARKLQYCRKLGVWNRVLAEVFGAVQGSLEKDEG